MLEWMTGRRRMEGGLYFGAPGWRPEGIEGLSKGERNGTDSPENREGFLEMLEQIGLGRTSAISPGLVEQMRDLGDRRIRALVVNLLPTQPEFALDDGLSRAVMADMTAGLVAIQKVVRAKRVVVATDRHDWRIRRLWRAGLKGHRSLRYTFGKLLNRYPQGHPTLLLWGLFGKRTAVGKLPTRANRMIVDAVACWGVGRYVRTGRRFDERPVQLFGVTTAERGLSPRLVMGRIGESVGELCGRYGLSVGGEQILRNGMLAGEEIHVGTLIDGRTESIAVRPRPVAETPTACFSCGWCLDICPTRLNPVNLLDLAERASRGVDGSGAAVRQWSWEAAESLHCIGCGLCSYVCPTRLPLTQEVVRLRGWVEGAREKPEAEAGR